MSPDVLAPHHAAASGFWLAYYHDLSGCAAFDDELEAYRYATPKSMFVLWCPFGADIREVVNR